MFRRLIWFLFWVGQKTGLDRQATLYEEQPFESYQSSAYSGEYNADGSSNSVKPDGYYNDSNYRYDGSYDYTSYSQDYSSYNYGYNYDYNYGYNDTQSGDTTTSTTTATTTTVTTVTTTSSSTSSTTTNTSSGSAKESTSTANQEEGYGYYDDTGYYYNGVW